MKPANAFNWREYTKQEQERTGQKSIGVQLNRNAKMAHRMTIAIDKVRETQPSFGTFFGISDKSVSVTPPTTMKRMKV